MLEPSITKADLSSILMPPSNLVSMCLNTLKTITSKWLEAVIGTRWSSRLYQQRLISAVMATFIFLSQKSTF